MSKGLKIFIVDDRHRVGCDGACAADGTDWSAATLDLARQRIKAKFTSEVELEYVDLSTIRGNQAHELSKKITEVPLPLLVVNGETRVTGHFDLRTLLNVIETELEIRD